MGEASSDGLDPLEGEPRDDHKLKVFVGFC
jgi:hypothetical protein